MYAYAIVPKKQLQAQGAAKFFNKPVASGPFMVTSLNKDSKLVPGREPALVRHEAEDQDRRGA